MGFRHSLISLFALLALAVPAAAARGAASGAVVFSRITQKTETKKVEGETPKPGETPKTETKTIVEGGLFAVKDGRLNQLTEDPTDTEPAFSPDGTAIAFVRGGDLFSVRADGSGLRQLTSGPELDSKPVLSPDGRLVVFERRAAAGAPADLYTVRARGGGLHAADQRRRRRPRRRLLGRRPQRSPSSAAPRGNDDIFSVRPSGARQARLTRTGGVDEFEPRFFAGGILFSRGESSDRPGRLRRRLHDAGQRHQAESAGRRRRLGLRRRRLRRRPHAALPPRPGPLGEADRRRARRASSASCPTARRPTASSPPTAAASPPSSPPRNASRWSRSTSPTAASATSPKAST